MQPIRWGILSTGNIAEQFAKGLAAVPDAELVAVGSRSQESADRFGAKYDVAHRHASYEALANDADVDVIYVATPHPLHAENTLLCLQAGKAVLCEKPFALNAAQAGRMIDEARSRKLFLMDAMWTRFLPHIVRLRELVAEGAIGDLRLLSADFGFRTAFDPKSRLFDPALGGGALLDVGIYPVALASMLLGTPHTISSQAEIGATGVDEQSAFVFGYNHGALAALTCATRTATAQVATMYGTKGSIQLNSQWWSPSSLTVMREGEAEQVLTFDHIGNGYNYEAAEVGACLRAGRTESAIMPLDETLELMRTLDTIRGQWGLRYPSE